MYLDLLNYKRSLIINLFKNVVTLFYQNWSGNSVN